MLLLLRVSLLLQFARAPALCALSALHSCQLKQLHSCTCKHVVGAMTATISLCGPAGCPLLPVPLLQNFVRSTEFFGRVAVIYGAYKATQLKAAVMRLQGSSVEPRVKVRCCRVVLLSSRSSHLAQHSTRCTAPGSQPLSLLASTRQADGSSRPICF